jgi:hypothetical protein
MVNVRGEGHAKRREWAGKQRRGFKSIEKRPTRIPKDSQKMLVSVTGEIPLHRQMTGCRVSLSPTGTRKVTEGLKPQGTCNLPSMYIDNMNVFLKLTEIFQ